jgi:hypothetical protein
MGGDNIVFEDLHGVQEDEPIEVDLDAGSKDDGISRSPDDQSAATVDVDDDDIKVGDIVPDDDSGDGDDDRRDASKPSEDDEYSKNVRSRIERERRAKLKERERGDYWEKQAKELAKRQSEGDKKELERTVEQADSAIERTRADLERAIEEGNTKDQVRLTDELTDWKARKARAESSLENLPSDGNVQPFDDKMSSEKAKTQSEANRWMDERGDWYRQPGFEKATRLANRLDKEVFKDGFDPNTPEYFEELDKRIKEKMPDLYDDVEVAADDDSKKPERRRSTRSPVAPVDGDQGRQRVERGSKVKLEPEDFANMRSFGLDTNDPEVLKEYARNKQESERRSNR